MHDSYQTTCPKCGAEGSLFVSARCYGMPLHSDGYCLTDAEWYEDEEIYCNACEWLGPMSDVTLEEEELAESKEG